MSESKPDSEPADNLPSNMAPEQDVATAAAAADEATMHAHTEKTSTALEPTEEPVPAFDIAAAAKKLNCKPDQDAVLHSIGILAQAAEERERMIAFYEDLFGWPTGYLMAMKDGFIKMEDVILMGERKLQGKSLQQAFLKNNDKFFTLEQLGNRAVIERVNEQHYAFAVMLPMAAKQRLDNVIRKVRKDDAKASEKLPTQKATKADRANPGKGAVQVQVNQQANQVQDATLQLKAEPSPGQALSPTPTAPTIEDVGAIPNPEAPSATVGPVPVPKTPTTKATPRPDSAQKRKRVIVISDDYADEEDNGSAGKKSKVA